VVLVVVVVLVVLVVVVVVSWSIPTLLLVLLVGQYDSLVTFAAVFVVDGEGVLVITEFVSTLRKEDVHWGGKFPSL